MIRTEMMLSKNGNRKWRIKIVQSNNWTEGINCAIYNARFSSLSLEIRLFLRFLGFLSFIATISRSTSIRALSQPRVLTKSISKNSIDLHLNRN